MFKAIENELTKAAKTVRNMRWFVVTEQRGHIENDAVAYLPGNFKDWIYFTSLDNF